jgi:hypothetical protein
MLRRAFGYLAEANYFSNTLSIFRSGDASFLFHSSFTFCLRTPSFDLPSYNSLTLDLIPFVCSFVPAHESRPASGHEDMRCETGSPSQLPGTREVMIAGGCAGEGCGRNRSGRLHCAIARWSRVPLRACCAGGRCGRAWRQDPRATSRTLLVVGQGWPYLSVFRPRRGYRLCGLWRG